MPEIHVGLPARLRGRRGVSGLGILLLIVGGVALLVSFSLLPASVYELWPVILIAVGAIGLLRPPGWIQELDLAVPGVADVTRRPRRGFSWFLIGLGLLLLLITTHAVDERLVGPIILIALGLLLVWRRSR
jgi:Domain of unknown function (DUF5668)